MTKIYQSKDGKTFYDFLARNSEGLLVLENRETKKPHAFSAEEVDLVQPYTVQIESVNGSNSKQHYTTAPGSVNEGDLLLIGKIYLGVVVAVDTKKGECTNLKAEKIQLTSVKQLGSVPE